LNNAHKKAVTLNTKFKFFFEFLITQTKDLKNSFFLKFLILNMKIKLKIKFLEKKLFRYETLHQLPFRTN